MADDSDPQLAPPGAGLPPVELAIARFLFAAGGIMASRAASTAKFQAEREKIRRLLAHLDPELGARRVLIKRVMGMEDSSRYWSIWMTLDHLRIIHEAFIRVIGALAMGVKSGRQASTAAVKPSAGLDATILPRYEASCDALLAAAAAVPELRTPVRFAHPWFGPLDAAGWYRIAGVHMAIHRVQMERIIAGLAR
jgi:hypothetical protein